ncbi:hypothetical protein MMPV_007720 [Pyropia vietnamensis]
MGGTPGSPVRLAVATAAAFVTPTPSLAALGAPTAVATVSWTRPGHAARAVLAPRRRCHAPGPGRWRASPSPAPALSHSAGAAPRICGLTMQTGGRGKKEGSKVSPLFRGVTVFLLAAFLLGSFVPFIPTITAFIKGDASTATSVLEARLRKVPVFAVTDGEGKPYLTVDEAAATAAGVGGGSGAAAGGGAVGYFFLDVADASAYLDAVRAQLPADEAAASSPILFPVGLDEALSFTAPASFTAASAVRRANGVGASERFVLRPSAGEAATAEALTGGQFTARFGADAVPLFYIDGLAVVDEPADGGSPGGTIYPLFFRKAELDAYVAAAEARDPSGVAAVRADGRLEVRVVDLLDVVAEIRRGAGGRLGQVVFSPPADSVAFMHQRLAAAEGGGGGAAVAGTDAGAKALAPVAGKGGAAVDVGAAMTTPFGGK